MKEPVMGFENPFEGDTDPDRHALWDMLVERDAEGYCAGDWNRVAEDFDRESFEGVMACGSSDPADWKITYPSLDEYRDDWLKGAQEYGSMPLVRLSHRDLLYSMMTLDSIEIRGDIALCTKRFVADEPLRNGGRYRVACQTVYRVRRLRGRWKIVGFIGELPSGASSTQETCHA
jgi:hypothetical protein